MREFARSFDYKTTHHPEPVVFGMSDRSRPAHMIYSMASDGEESLSQGITRDESIHEKLEPTKAVSIGPADVLCGRGKTSFNHGTFRLTERKCEGQIYVFKIEPCALML